MEKEALLYYRKDESMMAELMPSTFFIYLDLGCGSCSTSPIRFHYFAQAHTWCLQHHDKEKGSQSEQNEIVRPDLRWNPGGFC